MIFIRLRGDFAQVIGKSDKSEIRYQDGEKKVVDDWQILDLRISLEGVFIELKHAVKSIFWIFFFKGPLMSFGLMAG